MPPGYQPLRTKFTEDGLSDSESVTSSNTIINTASNNNCEEIEIEVQVSDGHAERALTISSEWKYIVLKYQVSCIMEKGPNTIDLAYKAPWCRRPNEGLVPRYISNDEEYQAMFQQYKDFKATEAKKKGKTSTACEITLINIEKTVVCHSY